MLQMEVTTSPLVKIYTLQEFWDLPEPADRSKLELIKGVLYMTPPPDYPHDKISALLNQYLIREIGRCGYSGEVFVPRAAIWVDDDTYLEPDLMYLSEELQRQMDPRHRTHADIVVEVISPSSAVYDRRTKSDTYRAMGVRELWLLDPVAKEVEVRSFQARSTRLYTMGDVASFQGLVEDKNPSQCALRLGNSRASATRFQEVTKRAAPANRIRSFQGVLRLLLWNKCKLRVSMRLYERNKNPGDRPSCIGSGCRTACTRENARTPDVTVPIIRE